MVKWKFGLNLEFLETWTEFGIQFINALLSPKSVDGFLLASLMTPLPIHFTHFILLEGNLRKCLRGGRCGQVPGFAHLLHATFGRPLNSIKNASKRSKLPSLQNSDLPVRLSHLSPLGDIWKEGELCADAVPGLVEAVGVGKLRSRRERLGDVWRRAGAGAFPTPNQISAYQLSFQIIYWALQQKCNHIVVGPCCSATWTNHLQQFRLQNHPFESSLSPTSSRRESWASSLSGFSSGSNVSVLLFWDHFCSENHSKSSQI